MIIASNLELRAGARLLLDDGSFQVAPGDKIGLVGRNGAGKTTLARVLAAAGLVTRARAGRAVLYQRTETGAQLTGRGDRPAGAG